MSYYSNDFFVRGSTSLSEQGRQADLANPDMVRMHEAVEKYGWEKGVYCYDGGLTAPYFMARAKREKGTIVGVPGMNVIELMDQADVHHVNDLGYSLIWTTLPEARPGAPLNMDAVARVRTFLTSQRSPVHSLTTMGKPLFIGTHSTSGRIVLELQNSPKESKILGQYFHGIVHANPFIDTANSAEAFDLLNNLISEYYFRKNHDLTPHQTLLGKAYLLRNAAKEGYSGFIDNVEDNIAKGKLSRAFLKSTRDTRKILRYLFSSSAEETMTYGHILELRDAGRALKRDFNPELASKIPTIFVLSENDPFSCRRTTELFIARPMGISPIIAHSTKHYPFREDKASLVAVLEQLDHLTWQYQERMRTVPITPEEFFASRVAVQQDDAGLFDVPAPTALQKLRDRAGAALQRGTGLLNPAAGLF